MILWDEESSLREKYGDLKIAGTDEAGAGPLAGRVYAAAVMLPFGLEIPYLNDSKKISPKRREALYDEILHHAVSWAVSWIEPEEIDRIDILNSRIKAMQLAASRLDPAPDFLLIDGNRDHGSQVSIMIPHETLVKGDGRSPNIAAASILAKVSRDRYMTEMASLYPEYHFEQHKGYPTKLHYEMLRKYGPCPIHRLSFLKNMHS